MIIEHSSHVNWIISNLFGKVANATVVSKNTYSKSKSLCCLLLCIMLFSCSSRNTPAPVVSVYGSVPLKERVKHSIHGSEYTVKSGETLYSIAWRANSDVRQLVKLNNLAPPYNIYPGQKLFLVAKNSQKSIKSSNNKASSKKQNTSSTPTSTKVVKKPIASNKKQAYGENVAKKKVEKNNTAKTRFSQKISRWRWPVKGRVISKFSSKAQGNKGIDITGQRGTNVRAAADGKVVYAGSALRGYGKLVIIKHNDDYLSAYAHNDSIQVKDQQQIKAGDIVAKMGDTDAQRVMLHFEVRFRGKSVDPLKYLPKQ
jgi:lipoprotein NlpD